MLNNLEQFSHSPKKQEFAAIFRLVSRISFLGTVSTWWCFWHCCIFVLL